LENQAKRYKWEQDQIAHMKVNALFDIMPPVIHNSYLICRTILPGLAMAAPNLPGKHNPKKKLSPRW